ncbi:MAG: hypothetical protein AB1458_09220 [Bacteroidota bacterium]
MLLPSMSITAVRRELIRDLPGLERRSKTLIRRMEGAVPAAVALQSLVLFYDQVSGSRNNWICRVYMGPRSSSATFMTCYYSRRGLGAVTLSKENKLLYFTEHLLQRYNERRNLGLIRPDEVIRAFMNDNYSFHFERLEDIYPGVSKIFCRTESGVLLGTAHEKLDLLKMNTFLTTAMLKGNQVEMEAQLSEALEKYKNSADRLE